MNQTSKRRRFALAAGLAGVAALLLAPAARAQAAQAGAPAAEPTAVALQKMHQSNQMEMRAAQLALERASDEDVRDLAERLFRDHRFADRKVLELADELGVDVTDPAQASAGAQPSPVEQKLAALATLQGAAFERAYLNMMVESHQQSIRSLAQVRPKVDSEEVSELIGTLLPILGQHLELARILEERRLQAAEVRS